MSLPLRVSRAAPPDGPTVRALAALWDEVRRRPLWAPPTFWRYVRLRWRVRLRQLDPRDVAVAAPRGKVNDCGSCTEICCVGPRSTVLLGLKDIAVLKDIGRADLISQRKPSFAEQLLVANPALKRHVGSRAWEIFPVLSQDSMGACRALGVDGRCGLYPAWPQACARFPYALHLDDREVFYSRRCRSFWIHPQGEDRARSMADAAVGAYNERVKDLILLAYARETLGHLGLLEHLCLRD